MSYDTSDSYDNYDSDLTDCSEDADTELYDSETSDTVGENSDAELYSENSDASDGASPEVRAEINEKSDYSQEVNDHIKSTEELEVYQNAGLRETEVNGRTCLVRDDIDYDYVDPKTGKTNAELMEDGRAPYDAQSGERIELHHIGQDYDSPLAELKADSEHGDGNHSILHTETSDSWRQDKELNNAYNNHQRPDHWKARAK